MDKTPENSFSINEGGVEGCKTDFSKYFHPQNPELSRKFLLLYKLCGRNDDSFGREIGVVRQTMNRYRRGIWIPDQEMQIKICKNFSEKIGQHVDSKMLWGDWPLEVRK